MKAIILAAGKGVRLNGVTGDEPKCLMKFGGLTLIERQIRTLRMEGLNDIVVVVGYKAERVRQVCGPGVRFVENAVYEQTNSLFSLWLTRHLLSNGFLVMNSDVLFHHQLLNDLLSATHPEALLVSYHNETTPPLGDEEMKVRVEDGRIIDISKEIDPHEADGENVGIAKFGAEGAQVVLEHITRLIEQGAVRDWAPRAFREFALSRTLRAVSTRGRPWIEIDFPEDYKRAVEEILPRLNDFNSEIDESQMLALATEAS